ncbi:MAG: efflux RND transporter periplasmic adaptor subunit [Planctomycetota bacterium]
MSVLAASIFSAGQRRLVLAGLAGLAIAARPSAQKPTPAHLEKAPGESDLTRVRLTPQAEERLGVATTAVAQRPVARMRLHGGEVVVAPGAAFTLSAPVAGWLEAVDARQLLVGQSLAAAQPCLRLRPLLSPDARTNLEASIHGLDGDVERGAVQLDAATAALAHAERLLRDRIGSSRAVEEARAAVDLAHADLESAQRRRDLLRAAARGLDDDPASTLTLVAPIEGVVQTMYGTAGMVVAAGAPLLEILDLRRLWVRVAVRGDDVAQVDRSRSARIVGLDGRVSDSLVGDSATAVAGPPAADLATATVWIYYALDARAESYRPGQRVGVQVPFGPAGERQVLPWAAVLHDVHGGTWVYARVDTHTFERRRVEVEFVDGDAAVLARGPAPGTEVVVAGAAELFGTEFGGGK